MTELHAAILAGLPTTPISRTLLQHVTERDPDTARRILSTALRASISPCCPHPLHGWGGWSCELTDQLSFALWHHACGLPAFVPLRVEMESAPIWGAP